MSTPTKTDPGLFGHCSERLENLSENEDSQSEPEYSEEDYHQLFDENLVEKLVAECNFPTYDDSTEDPYRMRIGTDSSPLRWAQIFGFDDPENVERQIPVVPKKSNDEDEQDAKVPDENVWKMRDKGETSPTRKAGLVKIFGERQSVSNSDEKITDGEKYKEVDESVKKRAKTCEVVNDEATGKPSQSHNQYASK